MNFAYTEAASTEEGRNADERKRKRREEMLRA